MNSSLVVDVFVLAQNRLLREALPHALSKRTGIRVVGANTCSAKVHEQIVATVPDVIVLDSSGLFQSNAGLISRLKASVPAAKLVMVDMDSNEDTFLRAICTGVVGYVLRNASALELASTIHSVAAGEAVCPPSLTATLFRHAARPPATVFAVTRGVEVGLSRGARRREVVAFRFEPTGT